MDVRDKLLFEPEYAGNVKEKIPPKSSLRIPWGWLPGALCLLQEVQTKAYTSLSSRNSFQWCSIVLLKILYAERITSEKNELPLRSW